MMLYARYKNHRLKHSTGMVCSDRNWTWLYSDGVYSVSRLDGFYCAGKTVALVVLGDLNARKGNFGPSDKAIAVHSDVKWTGLKCQEFFVQLSHLYKKKIYIMLYRLAV